MTTADPGPTDSHIESLCSEFRERWQREDRHRIANLMEKIDSTLRELALERLVKIDIELRIHAGDHVVSSDYANVGEAAVRIAGDCLEKVVAQLIPRPTMAETVQSDEEEQQLERTIGPYRLIQRIGEGGMGTVYMAQQEQPVRRRVALKVIKSGMNSNDVIARFEAERQALAIMDHQNIARVLDAGTTQDGRPYFAMELVLGIPITQYCDKNRVSINDRLLLFTSICDAIQHAHQKGIIHRDIKPSNVLVEAKDGKPLAKVIDFGLAKALHQKLTEHTMFTQFGQVVGTLEYMSPEQAGMTIPDVDSRTDIYSLGVLLYELLTGSTPLERKRVQERAFDEVLRSIREDEPPRPSVRLSNCGEASSAISKVRQIDAKKLGNLLRGELDWIVMKALEKDRTRRFASATEFAHDIKRYLDGEAVESRPPSAAYRLHKMMRKHKVGIATCALLLATICSALVVSIWSTIEANASATKLQKRTTELVSANSQLDDANQSLESANSELIRSKSANTDKQIRLLIDRSVQLSRIYPGEDARTLLPIVEALQMAEEAGSSSVEALRIRLATKLGQHSKPVGQINLGHPVKSVDYSPDGRFGIAVSSDRKSDVLVLWRTAHNDGDFTTIRTESPARKVVFHPDSKIFACGSASLELRGTENGKLECPTIGRGIGDIAFSPDGSLVACVESEPNESKRCQILVADAASGEVLHRINCESQVSHIAFSRSGEMIAGAFSDDYGSGGAGVWNTKTGSMVTPLLQHPRGPDPQSSLRFYGVDHVAFAANDLLISATFGSLKVWDVAAKKEISSYDLPGKLGNVTISRLQCTADGMRILVVANDFARVLTVPDFEVVADSLGRSGGDVIDATLARGDSTVLTSDVDGTATIWDIASGQIVGATSLHGGGPIKTVAYSDSSDEFATGGEDGLVRRWSAAGVTSNVLCQFVDIAELAGAVGGAVSGTVDPSGTFAAGISPEKKLQLIRLEDGETRTSDDTIDFDSFFQLVFSPNSELILITGGAMYAGIAQVRRVSDLSIVAQLDDPEARFLRAVFSHDGSTVAMTAGAGSVQVGGLSLWSTSDWKLLHRLEADNEVGMFVPIFSTDGRTVYVSDFHGEIIAWDVDSGETLAVMKDADLPWLPWIHTMSISPHQQKLVACMANDRIARGWDLQSFERYASFVHDDVVTSAAFDSSGRFLVTTSSDRTARIWSTTETSELSPPLIHDDRVSYATFVKDGRYVVTTSDDRTARVWSVPEGLSLSGEMRHRFPVVEAVFRRDRSDLLTRSRDPETKLQIIRAWPLKQNLDSVEDLRRQVQMLSQHRYDAVSGVTRLPSSKDSKDSSGLREPDSTSETNE